MGYTWTYVTILIKLGQSVLKWYTVRFSTQAQDKGSETPPRNYWDPLCML